MGKLLHFPKQDPPCDDDYDPGPEQHRLDIVVDTGGHPRGIVCSCGAEFNVSEVWGEE